MVVLPRDAQSITVLRTIIASYWTVSGDVPFTPALGGEAWRRGLASRRRAPLQRAGLGATVRAVRPGPSAKVRPGAVLKHLDAAGAGFVAVRRLGWHEEAVTNRSPSPRYTTSTQSP